MLIGLSGKAGSGKDTIAAAIGRCVDVYRIGFADHLKMEGIRQGWWTYEEAYVTKPSHVRTRLQQYGQGERQRIDSDTWVRTVLQGWAPAVLAYRKAVRDLDRLADRAIPKMKATGYAIVIPDVRYLNEAKAIAAQGGSIIRIVAPDRIKRSGLTDAQRAHSSETELDQYPFDYLYENDQDGIEWQMLQEMIGHIARRTVREEV